MDAKKFLEAMEKMIDGLPEGTPVNINGELVNSITVSVHAPTVTDKVTGPVVQTQLDSTRTPELVIAVNGREVEPLTTYERVID